jgi:DNA-binding beta-propeller fold protein YncE
MLARYSVPGAGKGDAITHDGRYLLAAAGGGAVVISTARALAGAPPVVGRLHGSPGMSGAAEVALSPDDRYAFVTVQDNSALAVFNLQTALATNFANSGPVGDVRVGAHPAGLAVAGNFLFVMNEGAGITVVSMSTAERDPVRAVVHTVAAGCGPARAMAAGHGQLWVTAACSDALLGFSTAKLVSDPAHALIARVQVGEQPLGLALIAGGGRIVVVDSDQGLVRGKFASLAVVDTRKALDGQPAVIGYIRTGALPREAALEQDGRTLLVTVTNSGRVQAVDLRTLR